MRQADMKLKGGFSKRLITPDKPVELWGYADREGISNGVLDDIYAKVLFFEDKRDRFAIIGLDMGGIDGRFAYEIKSRIASAINIQAANISVSATHTHSAPAGLELRNAGLVDEQFIKNVYRQCVDAAIEARQNFEPVSIGYGAGEVNISMNRRQCAIESSPDLDRESGTVDPVLRVIRIDRADSSPIAVIANYGMHPVTLRSDNLKISADFPGEFARQIKESLGCDAMFLQGPCGDVIPKLFGTADKMRTVGRHLAKKAIEICQKIESFDSGELITASETVQLPYERPPSKQWLQEFIKEIESDQDYRKSLWKKNDLEWARELLSIYESGKKPASHIAAPVKVVRLGNIVMIFLPGEVFVQTGQRIRSCVLCDQVFVVTNSNEGAIGYLLTKDMFAQSGYEVQSAYRFYGLSRICSDAEERIVNCALDLVKKRRL